MQEVSMNYVRIRLECFEDLTKHHNSTHDRLESWIWTFIVILPKCFWGFIEHLLNKNKGDSGGGKQIVLLSSVKCSFSTTKLGSPFAQITFEGMDGSSTSIVGNSATCLNGNPNSNFSRTFNTIQPINWYVRWMSEKLWQVPQEPSLFFVLFLTL